jgi:hypothetical protein
MTSLEGKGIKDTLGTGSCQEGGRKLGPGYQVEEGGSMLWVAILQSSNFLLKRRTASCSLSCQPAAGFLASWTHEGLLRVLGPAV